MEPPVDGHGDAVVAVLLLDRVQIRESVVGRQDDLRGASPIQRGPNSPKIENETTNGLVSWRRRASTL